MPIKFLGTVPAGFPSPASDYMEEDIDLNLYLRPRPHSTFLVRVCGDSMINAHIPPGSLVVVDRAITPVHNAIVIATVDGENTIKYFIQNKQGCALVPANAKYRMVRITEGMDFSIWGVVTHIIIDVKCLLV
jgi:DNA polymerase V